MSGDTALRASKADLTDAYASNPGSVRSRTSVDFRHAPSMSRSGPAGGPGDYLLGLDGRSALRPSMEWLCGIDESCSGGQSRAPQTHRDSVGSPPDGDGILFSCGSTPSTPGATSYASSYRGGPAGPSPLSTGGLPGKSTATVGGAPRSTPKNSGSNAIAGPERPSMEEPTQRSSQRSSFASEQPAGGDRRDSLGSLRGSHHSRAVLAAARASQRSRGSLDDINDPVFGRLTAAIHREWYTALAVLPPDTPVPLALLQQLWHMHSLNEAQQAAEFLQATGLLRLALLEDGSRWGAVGAEHMIRIQAGLSASTLKSAHLEVLSLYTDGGSIPLGRVPDDGYILPNITHHCLGAERPEELRLLLADPFWLEAKLHACGIGAIVFDFRRYLQVVEDLDVKLLLQAFQLSLGCCTEHPANRMLREQMLARLMAVSQAGPLRDWYDEQLPKCVADEMMHAGRRLLHLLPRTATLQQAGGKHRMTLRGHSAPINKVVISPNGHDVITISQDGSAQVWDMNIGDCVMQLSRDQPLTDVAVAASGAIAVVASEDGHCCIWDLATGAVLHVLKGHTAKVNALAIDRQGLRCASVSDDGSLRVWGLSFGNCELVLWGDETALPSPVHDVCISSDGTLAATVGVDFRVHVWDLDSEALLHRMEGHSNWVVSAAFIGTTNNILTGSHDCTARVWDAWRGKCLLTLEGHTGRLNKVTVDASGRLGVTCSDDFTARVWNLDSGACLAVLAGHSGWINDASMTRDGSKVITVSGDHTCILWDVATGTSQLVLEGHAGALRSVALTYKGRFAVSASDDCTARVWDLQAAGLAEAPSHGGKVRSLVTLGGGAFRVLSSGEDGELRVWEPGSGACTDLLEGHSSGITVLAASGDGSLAVTGSSDRQVCVWALDNMSGRGHLVGSLPAQQGSRVKCVAFDGALTRAAVVLYDSTVSVYDLASGVVISQLIRRGDRDATRTHTAAVNVVLLSRDGRTLVTAAKDCTARVWDVAAARCSAVVFGHGDGLCAAALSPDERLLATASHDGVVILSRLPDGTNLHTLRHDDAGGAGVSALAFSPDGMTLAVTLESRTVAVWALEVPTSACDAADANERLAAARVAAGMPRGSAGSVEASALGADALVRSSGSNTPLQKVDAYDELNDSNNFAGLQLGGGPAARGGVNHPVYDALAGMQPTSSLLLAHTDDVTAAAFSPDSRFLATCSKDCTVRVWQLGLPGYDPPVQRSVRQVAFFMADAALTAVTFAGHEADILVVGDASGMLHHLDFAFLFD